MKLSMIVIYVKIGQSANDQGYTRTGMTCLNPLCVEFDLGNNQSSHSLSFNRARTLALPAHALVKQDSAFFISPCC